MGIHSLSQNDIEDMETYIGYIRPEPEIREQLDIAFEAKGQSIFIFEVRPDYMNPKEPKIHSPVAKTTYVKKNNHWKIFWMRADLKWHSYAPHPIAESLLDFVKVVEQDKHGCFWG